MTSPYKAGTTPKPATAQAQQRRPQTGNVQSVSSMPTQSESDQPFTRLGSTFGPQKEVQVSFSIHCNCPAGIFEFKS